MYYLSKSLYIDTYGQTDCRGYWSVIAGAPGDTWLTELGDELGGRDRVNWEMDLEAAMERVWRRICRPRSSWTQRCTWRPTSSEFGDAFGGRDRVTQRCTWRPWWSEFGDALGGRDRVNSEMHLEAVIERVWRFTRRPRTSWTQRCTWRPRSRELGDALGGRDQASLEMHLEATIM